MSSGTIISLRYGLRYSSMGAISALKSPRSYASMVCPRWKWILDVTGVERDIWRFPFNASR